MKSMVCSTLGMLFLLSMSGCGHVIDWTKNNFPQGKDVKKELKSAKNHVRSVTVYDKFTTKGMFDALWLSDDVRTAYTNMHTYRRGDSDEQKNLFLRRQLEENNHFISFYVLTLFGFPLGDELSEWELFLRMGNDYFRPTEVKVVAIEPEYKAILGKDYTRFKEVYKVKFDAKDLDDAFLIAPEVHELALHFRSVDKETSLVWYIDEGNNLISKHEVKKLNKKIAKKAQPHNREQA